MQLITGSTGIDDWEWGVTLFADDPVALKEIVYEMRFDEVSARYGEFGPFLTGLVGDANRCSRICGGPMTNIRLHVSFPEELVDRPMLYEMMQAHAVVPNLRRAAVEAHSGWVILELSGEDDAVAGAIGYLEGVGCTVNRMEGDVLEG